jgi:glycosyltransferase involved in cell wall biosynthesis
MRILSLTAGAGGMYCGSCLRDNALATELIALGHDVLLVPLYTPTLTDEPNVSQKRVLFGGISVYLQQYSSFFRKTPRWLDRLWDSSLAIKAATHWSVSTDPGQLGQLTVSMLEGEDGAQRKEFLKLLQWLKDHPAPDVVIIPNSLLISLAKPIKEVWNRPVLCTLQGEDLFLEGLHEPFRSRSLELIRQNLDSVDGFIAVSDYCRQYMSELLGISRQKMHVVPLGIHVDGLEPKPEKRRDRFTIGYLARIAPEKGLHNLCEAYRRLRQRDDLPPLELEVAGYLGAEHRGYLRGIERQMKAWGLDGELHYHGCLDRQEKTDFLRNLDVFSVPSGYKEPKGLYLLEAMACGIPVVQPRHGAFPEIIEKTRGGVLVDTDDTDSLADGIASLAMEPERAHRLGRQGAEGVRTHHGAHQMALRALDVFEAVGRGCETASSTGDVLTFEAGGRPA